MTLRLRLTLALVALAAVGLVVFGVVTYGLYARSQYDRLDDQLRTAVPLVARQLNDEARRGPTTEPGGAGGTVGPPVFIAPATYAQLRDRDGNVVSSLRSSDTDEVPKLPDDLVAGDAPRLFTTGSAHGSGDWRVEVSRAPGPDGGSLVVAVPMTEVNDSLNRLIWIEIVAGGALLGLLALGSWLILRRGLHPLEAMASSARTITAGDLSVRVEPSDDRTEVGELGLALNTMLGEIEEAFREREATEQRLRQFLADASHELRTPLTSIQGFAELFRLDTENARVDLPVILRRIEEEAARMGVLVEDLLLLARLDETRPVVREPVDLAVLAADACSDAVAVAPDRQVTLVAPEPVVLAGDANHLRQAIANLVSNAIRHTPPGSAIEVGARLDGTDAVLWVRDHGPGLDPDALAHVFDRFWQSDPARVGTSAGLGLSIVAAIVEEHGGIATAANAPGGGAQFTLRLPMLPAAPEPTGA